MPTIVMLESSPISEYHGEFDLLPGETYNKLTTAEASRLVSKFPKVFKAIDFDVENEQKKLEETGEVVKMRFKHNKYLESYHGSWETRHKNEDGKEIVQLHPIDFQEWGDEQWIPFITAKQLLDKFPSMFEPVKGQPIKEEKEEVKETKKKEPKADSDEIDARIISALEKTPLSTEELKEELTEINGNETYVRIMQLSKKKRIQKRDDDDRWIIAQ